jgi:hypothetical protein
MHEGTDFVISERKKTQLFLEYIEVTVQMTFDTLHIISYTFCMIAYFI